MTPSDELFDESGAGAYLRKAPGTLKQWRYLGEGPAYVRVGRSIRYLKADLDAFLASNRIDPSAA